MTDETKEIEFLHRAYESMSGRKYRMDMHAWNNWRSHGWTKADLVMVIGHLKDLVRRGQKWQSCLSFNNLIMRVDRFGDALSEARALSRRPTVDPNRAQVLKATGRDAAAPESSARTSGDVLAASKAFEEFRAWRAANGLL